jgi:chromosome partitioning protein
MGRIITLAQQKGGAGKTTVLVHLAAAWAGAGRTVALIDLDPSARSRAGRACAPTRT